MTNKERDCFMALAERLQQDGYGCQAYYYRAYAEGSYDSPYDGQLDRFAKAGVADRLAGRAPNAPQYPL